MVSPVILKDASASQFIWNVDAKVGANAPNLRDDVDLVQLGYFFFLRNPTLKPQMTPEIEAAMGAVKPGDPCTGREDDPLVNCIRLHERARGGAQDGFVSPARHGEFAYSDRGGSHRKLILIMNMNIGEMNPNVYPRLDKISNCPPALAAKVVTFFDITFHAA